MSGNDKRPERGEYELVDWGQRFPEERKWNDVIWGILFYIHLVAIIVVGFMFFSKNQEEIMKPSSTNDDKKLHINTVFYVGISSILISALLVSFFWLWVIRTYVKYIIKICFWIFLFVSFGISIFLIATGHLLAGFVMLLVPLIGIIVAFCWPENAAKLAAVILGTVVDFIDRFPATIYFALLFIVLQAVWMVVFMFCAVGIFTQAQVNRQKGDDTYPLLLFILMLSFFWTSQVLKNIVHMTNAGAMATWYFYPDDQTPPDPTWSACKRALTTSFGSICLGSLLVAIIKAVRTVIQYMVRNENEFVQCIALCIIDCLDSLVSYFNHYAFTQISIYGMSYCEAGSATWQLLKSRGFAAVMNDDLIGFVVFVGVIFGGLISAGVGAVVAFAMHQSGFIVGAYALIGFLVGMALLVSVMEVVESAVAALFVCFAQDPNALYNSHREKYIELNDAFNACYGLDGFHPNP